MANSVSLALLAAAGAVGAGIWWLYRSARDSLPSPSASRGLHDGAPLRIPSRRERYLASLAAEIDDAPPPSSDWVGLAPFDDAPLSEGPMTERRLTARPHLAPPPLQSADDYEAVDADSLGPFFLARAVDSVD